jgi:hypothetical protein
MSVVFMMIDWDFLSTKSEAIKRGTDNTMDQMKKDKKTNNDLQNITENTQETRTVLL